MRDFFFKFSFVLFLRVKFINAEIEGREKIISIIKIISIFWSKILNLGTRPIRLELGRVHQFSQPSILLVMKSWSWGWYWCNMFCADPKVWLQGESHLHVQCSVKSKTIVHVSWGIKYPQAFIDQGKNTASKKLYRGPLQLLGRKYWLDEIGPIDSLDVLAPSWRMFEVLACWRPHVAGSRLHPSPHPQRLLLRPLPEVNITYYMLWKYFNKFPLEVDIWAPSHGPGWNCHCYKYCRSQEEDIQELDLTLQSCTLRCFYISG